MNQDEQHLDLLGIFHYVIAGVLGFMSCIPLIHMTIGLFFLAAPASAFGDDQPPPGLRLGLGLMFTIIPALLILTGWAIAALTARAGSCLRTRKSHTFCLVMAGILCMFMPFGTVLGVLTLIVLLKPEVKLLFEGGRIPEKPLA